MRTVRSRGLAILSGALLTAFLTASASIAHAEEEAPTGPPALVAPSPSASTPASRSVIADEMTGYYRSERNTAFTFIAIGAVSAGAGGALVAKGGDFSLGLGLSMISIGALEMLGSTFYAFQVGSELDHYDGLLARDPAAFKTEESTHIHGTTSRFFWYRTSELALVVIGAGVATYGFAADKDVWKGAGIGIAAEAATFFVLDLFGSSRAGDYEERVRKFDPKVAFSVGGGARPWSLDVGTRF